MHPPITPGTSSSETVANAETPKPSAASPATAVSIPKWVIVAAGVVALVLIAVIVIVVSTAVSNGSGERSTSGNLPVAVEPSDEPDTEPEPEFGPLTADSITLDVIIVSQQCFGSAGCNVEFEIEPTFGANDDPIEPGSVWAVTYELSGAEDPYINTFEVTVRETEAVGAGHVPHGTYTTSALADLVSTASASSELVARVTSVRER